MSRSKKRLSFIEFYALYLELEWPEIVITHRQTDTRHIFLIIVKMNSGHSILYIHQRRETENYLEWNTSWRYKEIKRHDCTIIMNAKHSCAAC